MNKLLFCRLILPLCLLFFSALTAAVDESTLLPPDEAFQLSITLENPETLLAQWRIADGYYLYKKRIKFSFDKSSLLSLGKVDFPRGVRLDDPAYGDVVVYRNTLTVRYPLQNYTQGIDHAILKAKYQGCADVGVCYPPIKKKIDLNNLRNGVIFNTSDKPRQKNKLGHISVPKPLSKTSPASMLSEKDSMLSEQDSIAASLASDSFFLTLFSFFTFGLLLAFTPCVFPMIPILSGIIIGQGSKISTRQAFSLSLAYVVAMALTYAIAGVLAAMFGTNLQIWFQNAWVLGIFAAIFIALSLSMFGFYDLQMPSAIQEKLNNISNRQESGKLISAAVMGLLSALIVGPCVTAPLIGALIYIGQTGDTLLGGSALFALGMGMGAPLLVIGTSAGKIMPRSGAWMEIVKYVFGVLMIAVAIWLVSRVLPTVISQLLWAILLITSGIYLGALRQHNEETSQWQLLWKGLGFTLVLYGSIMVIGASTGTGNLMQPLAPLSGGTDSATQKSKHSGIMFQQIKGLEVLNDALKQAESKGQVVMLDFYADWCISCKEMEESTFLDARVTSTLSNALSLQADVTKNDALDVALLKHFDIIGPPAILFFDHTGQELKSYRIVGYTPPDEFFDHLTNVMSL